MKNTNNSTNRTRNYACIVYPESAPENWRDIVAALHIPILISPLHDRDTMPDGSPKKEHYHLIALFQSVKSRRQAEEIFKSFSGIGAEAVNCVTAYARYLVHLDNPEKAQYSKEDVVALSGANFEAVSYIPDDDLKIIQDMIRFIRDNQIISFSRFVDLCTDNNPEWLKILTVKKVSHFFFQYIKSLAWDMKGEFNYETDRK